MCVVESVTCFTNSLMPAMFSSSHLDGNGTGGAIAFVVQVYAWWSYRPGPGR
ncbi:hypothetical protein BDU57DRAFT_522268 [Ampelomyces quisqualis]|uniref:Uncharacterized protein n=1 Tax=Ampelomyces quisqualis TaxID=50730 RepID=A0A6A5QDE4_AMPQU|nr:hypothetical protein BDU57DRAFT_522268 [Ampelomyces quisqualis]